jgi:GNAT superfamily N-acetyltransferase
MAVDLENLQIFVSWHETSPGFVSAISANCKLGRGDLGTASVDRLTRRQWTVTRVFIPEKYRGKGVGGALLERLKKELLLIADFRQVYVEPSGYGSDPKRLHNFYTRHGFEKKGDNIYVWGRRGQERAKQVAQTEAGS